MSSRKKETSEKTAAQAPLSEREINRRKFVQKILASMPAVGLACSVPLAMGASKKPIQWACRIGVQFEFPTYWVYTYIDCDTESIFFMAGPPDLPCNGDCDKPTSTACIDMATIDNYATSDDTFRIYYMPELSKEGRRDFEKLRDVFLYNLQYS